MSPQDIEKLLLRAAENEDVDQARTLLDKGTNPNAKGASESTPLHYAAKKGIPQLVKLLLEYGADPNAKEDSESTSLHHATQDGHDGIVQLLLDYWADPNAKNGSGSTPLHVAVKGKNVLVVKLLLDSGADREARDSEGSTPRFFPSQEDISWLLNSTKVDISQQAQETPAFPITINGNIFNQPTKSATESFKTKYILVQCRARLSSSDRQELEYVGVKHLDYVSKNTYLCQYQDGDREKVRQLGPVIYVDIYRTEFKITPNLKEAKQDQDYEVDIVFHENVSPSIPNLRRDIVEKSRSVGNVEFLSNKARLTMRGLYLDAVASIDDIRRIEHVGEVVTYNDEARRILRFDPQQYTGLIQQQAYKGSGQVVAVADTGLHRGENMPDHPAFRNRVQRWFTEHGFTEDHHGHGTHVCGSAVGDGMTARGDRVMGTAPQAKLIVQSIWDPAKVAKRAQGAKGELNPPKDLTRLFDRPYSEGARVHSNSWGMSYEIEDAQGNKFPFRQMDYTTGATEIDRFVWDQPDVVICFAAGKDGEEPVDRSDKGHMGAEAAAKNCITVGASRSSRDQGLNPDDVADFSDADLRRIAGASLTLSRQAHPSYQRIRAADKSPRPPAPTEIGVI